MSMAQAVPVPANAESFAIPDLPIWQMSVEQYHAMIQAGILTEDDRLELLDGWLVPKMSKNPRHVLVLELLAQQLQALLPAGWYLRRQEPITLPESEPEPDLCVVRGTPRTYLDHHPEPQDVGLVVEVADTTLAVDRGRKLSIYARAQLPEYWIINLARSCMDVYRHPIISADGTGHYSVMVTYHSGQMVSVMLHESPVGEIEVDAVLN